jgi:hypothetical protein
MAEGEEKNEEVEEGASQDEVSAYNLAEEGWRELVAAAQKIQRAANLIKKSKHSIDGYNIERALKKHKPDLMANHLDGLRDHRKETDR